MISVILIILIICFLLSRKVVGPKKSTPPSAKTVSGKNKRILDSSDDDDDDQDASGGGSPQRIDSAVKKRKINRNGLVTLTNGVVSMRELVLSSAVPTKGRDDDARTLFGAKLSWGHSYALFTLVMFGKEHPVEKARDVGTRLKIMFSSAPYSISDADLSEILEAEPEQRHAYLHGMTKAAPMHCIAKSAICSMKRYSRRMEFNRLKQ